MEQQKPLNGKQLIDLLTSSVVDEDVLVDYPLVVRSWVAGVEWSVKGIEVVAAQDTQGNVIRKVIISI